jgi:5'(3')-deoxyribonucleotidase
VKPRVLLDVDGVLADFVGAFLGVVRDRLGREHTPEDIHSFGIANSLNLSKDEFDTCAEVVSQPGFGRTLAIYPGAQEGVAALQRIADVYIVTSPWNSNPTWTHDREWWLYENFHIPYNRVVHTSAKHLVRGDVLVDDKVDTVATWCEEHPGCTGIVWDTPHNRREPWGWLRTNSWDRLIEEVRIFDEAVLR